MSRNIYFTGFMASGKSRVGKLIAEHFQREYVDSDAYISEKVGKSVSEIFEQDGELEFRALEREAIKELAQKENLIVSLGGGTLTQKELVHIIKDSGTVICMKASPEILSERIGRNNKRPLMAGLNESERFAKIKTMLKDREKFYTLADFNIESNEEPPENRVIPQVLASLELWEKKAVNVQLSSGDFYPIFIGNGITRQIDVMLNGLNLFPQNQMLVCTDSNIAKAQFKNLQVVKDKAGNCEDYVFPAGEVNKNIDELNKLWTHLLQNKFSRKTCLLQFSGGVVGDMAGFAAATYQRGVNFVQMPTSLLAMVDSSVGGKVAVNHPEGKNMIGAFYHPKAVMCDLSLLETLPTEEFYAGLAEVVKYGIIYDADFFDYLEKNANLILAKDKDALIYIVRRSCEIKAEVVGIDEKETGLRAILNYGHTFGHAIEKITNYEKFSHGIAVGLGMRVAGRLSTIMGYWNEQCEQRQNDLLTAFKIPKSLSELNIDINPMQIWNALSLDKKAEKQKVFYILPTKIGAVEKTAAPSQNEVFTALNAILAAD